MPAPKKLALILLLLAYLINFYLMSFVDGFPLEEAFSAFVILGLIFSLIAYFVSRHLEPGVRKEVQPEELLLILLLFLYLSTVLIFGSTWILTLLPDSIAGSPATGEIVSMIFKLTVFVIVPFSCYRIFYGFSPKDFGLIIQRGAIFNRNNVLIFVTMTGLAFILQWFGGRAAAPIRNGEFSALELLLGFPIAFAWLFLEVGLVEEFFFRSLIQDRLAGLVKSEWLGIALGCLLFGIAHAPGMYFRGAGEVEGLGTNPSFLTCVGYCIAVQSAAGIPFGIIWSKTRNLWLLMAIHASFDLLSNFPSLAKAFGL